MKILLLAAAFTALGITPLRDRLIEFNIVCNGARIETYWSGVPMEIFTYETMLNAGCRFDGER